MQPKRTLHLTLKKKWFDMILSGVKKEEYREVKDYWMKRIAGIPGCGTNYNFTLLRNHGFNNTKHIFDSIVFKNGYSKLAPTIEIECTGVIVDQGKKIWGAPNYRVFVLKLGKIIRTENIKGDTKKDEERAKKERVDAYGVQLLEWLRSDPEYAHRLDHEGSGNW